MAAPATTECGKPAAFTAGPVHQAGPTPTLDGALFLAAEILWPEVWPAAHNRDLWVAEPVAHGGNAWRNDGTGHSYDD